MSHRELARRISRAQHNVKEDAASEEIIEEKREPLPAPKEDHISPMQAEEIGRVFPVSIDDRATRRVIAPFLHVVRRGRKAITETKGEIIGKAFSVYLQKKPSVLLKDLSSFLSDSVDLPSLLHETSDVLKLATDSKGVVLYMVDKGVNEIHQSPRYVVNPSRHRVSWKIRPGKTVAAYVAHTKSYVMVDDILTDERFPDGVGWKGPIIKAVLCVPVVGPDGDCLAVIELYRDHSGVYQERDLDMVSTVTDWMAVAVQQNYDRLTLQKQQELNEYLSELTTCYFTDTVHIEKIISEIVHFTKATLGAERGSFFVVNKTGDELVGDLFDEGVATSTVGGVLHKKKMKLKFDKERRIADVVAHTGKTINVADATTDPQFSKSIDRTSGFITRSILCMPIMGKDEPIGVIEMINKKSGGCFTAVDEALFQTFSTYCSLVLHYAKLHDTSKRDVNILKKDVNYNMKFDMFYIYIIIKQSHTISKDMLEYHMSPTYFQCHAFNKHPIIDDDLLPLRFNEFDWYCPSDWLNKMTQLTLYMMTELVGEFFTQTKQFNNFLLIVHNSYRCIPYHNFENAFHTTHLMYNILRRNLDKFTVTEVNGLMIAALCLHINHKGFTNSFLQLTKDPLACLYGYSSLEIHHCDVTMLIMKITGVFDTLTEQEYRNLTLEIKQGIMATDLSHYFRCKNTMVEVLSKNKFDWQNPMHRSMIKSLIIKCCDLYIYFKSYKVHKRMVRKVYKESYNQGEIMKSMGLSPIGKMDRTQQHMVPETEVNFIDLVCLPCAEIIGKLLPNTQPLTLLCGEVLMSWNTSIDVRGQKIWVVEESEPKKIKTTESKIQADSYNRFSVRISVLSD